MPIQEIQLIRNGPDPQLEVTFGYAQIGKYRVELMDEYGFFLATVQVGTNVDNVEDKFPLGKGANALDRCFLSWDIAILAPVEGPGQLYSTQLILTQGSHRVIVFEDGPQGLNGTKYLTGLARLTC